MSKVNALKAKHDELFADLQGYLDDPEADLQVAESKEQAYQAVKADLESAVALTGKVDAYKADNKARSLPQRPTGLFNFNVQTGSKSEVKTVGQMFVASDEYKTARNGRFNSLIEIPGEIKTTLTSSALTGYERPPGIITLGTQRPVVADLIAQGTTDQPTIRVTVENSFTNYASTVPEGGTRPEAVWDLVETDFPVRIIGETAKVTNEMLADHPGVSSYIDNRLIYSVSMVEESQLLGGSGTSPQLKGFLNTSGVQTQAKSTDSNADAVHKAITKVRAIGFDEPTGIVVHPTDWQVMRLEKDSNGQYYGGGPFSGSYGQGGYNYMAKYWGLDVVVTTSITQGTALLGAFRTQAQIFRRQGLTLEMTNSNEDDFKKGLVCLRANERLALVIYRPKSFCTVTGIA